MTKDNIAQLSPPASQKSLVMKEAYVFSDRANEFTAPLGTNQRSLNKVIGTFLSAPTRPISEFSLSLFGKWYRDLPLAEVMTHNESEHCEERWQYNVILLYPKIVRKSKEEGRKFDWAISLANAFYVKEFNGTFEDMHCINMALLFDPTIMIVGRPLRANEVPGFSKSISRTKEVVVISAITFRNGTGNECGSSYVVWLLVAPSSASKPLQITSWRRQGFGRFMLIMLIKRSTIELLHFLEQPVCQEPIKGVDIYLQYTQVDAQAFYQSCGFVRINDSTSSGFELLPKSISATQVQEENGGFAWISPDSDEHAMIPLMRLRSGSLLNSSVVEEPTTDVQSLASRSNQESTFLWCRYPPSTIPSDANGTAVLTNSDLEEAYKGLDLLDQLVPPPMNVLLVKGKLRLSGEMLSYSRLDHSRAGGTSWMKNNELEMMCAFLMRDGRYESSVTIMPFRTMQNIEIAFQSFVITIQVGLHRKKLTSDKIKELQELAKEHFKDLEKNDPGGAQHARRKMVNDGLRDFADTIPDLIEKKFGDSENEIQAIYERRMNSLVKSVLVFHPGFLEKKVIVFPINFRNSHWGATFVFNSGEIPHPSNQGMKGALRTCFFRYCSLFPSGTRRIKNKHGIIWFLNLAFSYAEQRKRIDSAGAGTVETTTLKWFTPFGNQYLGDMVGTEKFPALKVLEDGVLPKQKDDYNCGIGLVAAIGIILRDLLGRSTVSEITRYNEMFDHSSMNVEKSSSEEVEESPKELVYCFPRGTFQSLPTTGQLGFRTYLHALKAQWFTLFDRYAELQHDILRKRRNNNYVVDPGYISLKSQLEDYAWPKHPPGAGNEKEGAAPEQGADQEAPSGADADGSVDQVVSPDPGADGGVDQEGADQVASPDPGGDVASPDPGADVGADQGASLEARRNEFSDEDTEEEVSVSLPPAGKVWKGVPAKKKFPHFDPEEEEPENWAVASSRYKTHVSGDDTSNFTKKWRTPNYDKEQPVRPRDEVEMNKFVEASFRKWNWSSSEEHQEDLRKVRQQMKLCINRSRKPAEKRLYKEAYQRRLNFMKKERKKFRRALELEWMFGNSASVHGLKYNPMTNTFQARLVYSVENGAGNMEEKEEIITVSEDWIKDANYGEGVVQHVINLGLHSEFVEVPPGRRIFIHTKKVHSVRYVHSQTMWVPHPDRVLEMDSKTGKRKIAMKSVPGYWEVRFHGEEKPMRAPDEDFLSNFKQNFLEEVKRMRCGFVDIPVGDFKLSHLQEHPNLHVHGSPEVHFVQSDGEDLCVSKSLASVFHVLGFTEEALMVDEYGKSELVGGTVDAIGKVGQFAQSKLPEWITRKVIKNPHLFNWEVLLQEQMQGTILLGVLNESDGNASHAVAIHGGYVYDANEAVAIPLCKESLDYCCSTSTVKNEFVSFRKATLFFFEGKDEEKKRQMTVPMKRKRENSDYL